MFRVVVKNNQHPSINAIGGTYVESSYITLSEIFVKESFSKTRDIYDNSIWYWADGNPEFGDWTKPKPAQHMKQEHSRLTLRIKSVKVERLQDIKEDGAKKEGFAKTFEAFPRANVIDETTSAYGNFIKFWNSTHKKPEEKWEANPWVFVYEYEVVK